MDWVGIVEAIYDLEPPSHDVWLTRLTEAIKPSIHRGPHAQATLCRLEGDTMQIFGVNQSARTREYLERSAVFAQTDAPLLIRAMNGPPAQTLSSMVGRRALARSSYAKAYDIFGMKDFVGLIAKDGGPWAVTVAVGLSKMTTLDARKARAFGRIAAHIHAALRLRFRLHGEPIVPQRPPGVTLELDDAVLTPDGKIEHAEGAAREHVEALRHAAVSIDRARGKMRRRDPDGALEAWRSLVEGEWSLVEVFESDGRRFMVARRNAPDAPRTPLLDHRERTVLGLRARAHGVKLIAYELGVSPSSVSRALSTASTKLGLQSMADIVRFVGSSEKN
jgi:DNA-binding CsgD family transcriptional regulator